MGNKVGTATLGNPDFITLALFLFFSYKRPPWGKHALKRLSQEPDH